MGMRVRPFPQGLGLHFICAQKFGAQHRYLILSSCTREPHKTIRSTGEVL